ncbi:vacuolar sorting 38 and autophagy-related subunit 14 domain-containing protein [Trichoderma breve]|uniref:Vacuolar sorting 38 and autophagy-related subunit 14 domain-containing protein n=1 Tax=Trichoderma breve TaxID=2034170 RepID=A0A9W9BN09_9HYPO|nr:vacuolar sorting 38 and autophagy-related subunit 14 domain-containing protein [Trichoderma breve]KAJ4863008.1 vacuolar sorting 38 and autophagy-related subunit 14 domain-containing protein [Trichoderma breve]
MSSLSEPRRPRLLPQNRKLRHLKGLSLRNLSFAPVQLRTSDDVALIRSPNKLGALKEAGQLHGSRSSDNLRHEALPERSRSQPPRRTSLSTVSLSPAQRQKRLKELLDDTLGDVFFSLHVAGIDEPVYVSEVRERSANFNFQFFDLASRGGDVSRSCRIVIRVWARRLKQTTWTFLLEELVDLRNLNFIGTLLDRQYPPNALIFHLEDGVYSFDFPTRQSEPRNAPPVATSSYNALMKLANLESSIEDAIQTQQRIMEQINEILNSSTTEAPDVAEQEVALAQKYVAIQQRTNKLTLARRDELQESLRKRSAAIATGRELQEKVDEDIRNNRETLLASKQLLEQTQQQIRGQRRRICSELADIFPITPIPNAPPLSFQICDVPLPNSIYDAATARTLNEDVLSAGLGLVALVTRHLQLYLGHALPYPLYHYGSRSYAKDDISLLSDKSGSRREFPLYLPRGGSTALQWRFEYAWFLLNKDIEALCASQGLKVVDIRQTLPNLKYLLYVCSAGSEEVPARKKGGVRGLWAGRLKGRLSAVPSLMDGESSSAAGSRRGSSDSDLTTQHADALRNAIAKRGDVVDGAWSPDRDLGLPFASGDAKFTLRTKGLRENIAG